MLGRIPLPIVGAIAIGLIVATTVAVSIGMYLRGDATWPTNRVASIVRQLADQCPNGKVVQINMERRWISVGCAVNDRIVMHSWSSGKTSTTEIPSDDTRQEFSLTDFDLEGAARLAAQGKTIKLEISASPNGLEVIKILEDGTREPLTPDLQPAPR